MADNDPFLSLEERRARALRRQGLSSASLKSKSDFGDMPGGIGSNRINSSSYEEPADKSEDSESTPKEPAGGPRINSSSYEGPAAKSNRTARRSSRSSGKSEADRLMDIYNKQDGSSAEDISSAYRSINPTMKKGGKVSPKKPTAPKAMKYARGGGIESRGKTRGKFV